MTCDQIYDALAAYSDSMASRVSAKVEDSSFALRLASIAAASLLAPPVVGIAASAAMPLLARFFSGNTVNQKQKAAAIKDMEREKKKIKEEIFDEIADKDNIIDFIEEYTKRNGVISEKKTDSIVDGLAEDVANRLSFVGHGAITPDDIRNAVRQTVAERYPEVETIPAIRELRAQLISGEPTGKEPYPGLRSGIDPLEYMEKHYGDDIRAGILGPGRLQRMDPGLYVAARTRLAAPSEGGSPMTVGEYFEQLAGDKRFPPSVRRLQACATILDASEEEAGRFFSSVRPERLKMVDRIKARDR